MTLRRGEFPKLKFLPKAKPTSWHRFVKLQRLPRRIPGWVISIDYQECALAVSIAYFLA